MSGPDEQALAALADEFGAMLSAGGLPRTTGRLLGWLLVCDPPGQSTSDLIEALHTSKASITTGMQLLVSTGMVERYHVRGSRETHYRANTAKWEDLMSSKLHAITAMRVLADRGLTAIGDDAGDRGARLQDVRDLYGFFEEGYADMVRRWFELKEARR